ncbi:hypothetical protein N0V90_008256 [Kalmusia sp. IMI 367209]|nr:hypothetical protein N0V90_008256 [Kalmusia sp. IMI 367209]
MGDNTSSPGSPPARSFAYVSLSDTSNRSSRVFSGAQASAHRNETKQDMQHGLSRRQKRREKKLQGLDFYAAAQADLELSNRRQKAQEARDKQIAPQENPFYTDGNSLDSHEIDDIFDRFGNQATHRPANGYGLWIDTTLRQQHDGRNRQGTMISRSVTTPSLKHLVDIGQMEFNELSPMLHQEKRIGLRRQNYTVPRASTLDSNTVDTRWYAAASCLSRSRDFFQGLSFEDPFRDDAILLEKPAPGLFSRVVPLRQQGSQIAPQRHHHTASQANAMLILSSPREPYFFQGHPFEDPFVVGTRLPVETDSANSKAGLAQISTDHLEIVVDRKEEGLFEDNEEDKANFSTMLFSSTNSDGERQCDHDNASQGTTITNRLTNIEAEREAIGRRELEDIGIIRAARDYVILNQKNTLEGGIYPVLRASKIDIAVVEDRSQLQRVRWTGRSELFACDCKHCSA